MTDDVQPAACEKEVLRDVIDLFHLRELLDKSPNAPQEWRADKAREILLHALDIARLMCGREVLSLAYGHASTEARKDHLLVLADRLHWPHILFAELEADAGIGSFNSASRECESVARGDTPELFAKLPGYRKNVRLLVAKYQANRWDAYLEGLGIPTASRHGALAIAFGQEWDTMSRWVRDASGVWGAEPIAHDLKRQRFHGEQDRQRFNDVRPEHWLPAVNRSGRTFKRYAGYPA